MSNPFDAANVTPDHTDAPSVSDVIGETSTPEEEEAPKVEDVFTISVRFKGKDIDNVYKPILARADADERSPAKEALILLRDAVKS